MNIGQLKFNNEQTYYKGKVRDVYTIRDQIIMVASDRISAFDHILPKSIPFKGQVLNQIAAHFLSSTSSLVPNWLEQTPHPRVSIGKACKPILVEMVVRGYLAGHAARLYKQGRREICGVALPEGLKEGDQLPAPIITPTTKAAEGHDEDISKEEILQKNIIDSDTYAKMEHYALTLYNKGQQMASERGLILVDTKYEFGLHRGELLLMDEIHTPDSSRYYVWQGYTARQAAGQQQIQLSKEFVREWLMNNGFRGNEGDIMPFMPDEFVRQVSEKYIDLFEKITGETFLPHQSTKEEEEILESVIPLIK